MSRWITLHRGRVETAILAATCESIISSTTSLRTLYSITEAECDAYNPELPKVRNLMGLVIQLLSSWQVMQGWTLLRQMRLQVYLSSTYPNPYHDSY